MDHGFGTQACVGFLPYHIPKSTSTSRLIDPLILTLGAQESWRIITKGLCPMHSLTRGGYGPCFNGIMYYDALDTDGHRIIMSFA
ncbi:hypothetical protein YC2023_096369 [Brassica napus]